MSNGKGKLRSAKPRGKTTKVSSGGDAKKTPTGYFLSLTVSNLRCFGHDGQTLNLQDASGNPARWTILLGNNGAGKTTLLRSLAYLVTDPVSCDPPRSNRRLFDPAASGRTWPKRRLTTSEWNLTLLHNSTVSSDSVPKLSQGAPDSKSQASIPELRIAATYCTNWLFRNAQEKCDRIDRRVYFEINYKSRDRVSHFCHNMFPDSQKLSCLGYGPTRRIGATTVAGAGAEADDPCASLFDDKADLRNAEEWLLRLDYSASKKSAISARQKQRREQVKQILIELLPEVSGIRITTPSKTKTVPGVEFETPFGWVPLAGLGHGYRTLIAWVVDFASRMVDEYPDSPSPLDEPAIVLVDELDLHLHPTWQRKVIQYLSERFANTQFIVTAHSPLIVQAAGDDANVALLKREGDHVVIYNDMKPAPGMRIDQILTSELYGLETSRPPQLEGKLKRRKELLTKSRMSKKDKTELAALESHIGELPVGETAAEAAAMKDLVDRTEALLKKHGKKA